MKRTLFLSLILLTNLGILNAQDTTQVVNPIEKEFNTLIETSNDYQGFKVVDYNELIKLRNNTTQFFSRLNDEIITQQNTIDQQQEQIEELREDLESTQRELEEVRAEKDEINFLGMPFSKSSYMTLMWSVIGILLLALIFFIYKYKKSHQQTSEAREKLATTEKEFEAYRTKALEKEQRLGRLLQDEKNKNMEK